MSDVVIKTRGLGKKYIISHAETEKYTALRDVISEKAKGIFKTKSTVKEEFWALKDISFEIKRGEAIGIIGRNGAGKSTLLKILSRIVEPTEGRAELDGRVSSLLEVGTGFHPELTGRENVFLNGAVLGMSRIEIKNKFDAIVDFSGVEKFLDTPVKRYSSGMYLRLAFSVAAHLEPEILIVDEVLAVGDLEFQKKCLGKMNEVGRQEGRTILFVSHNMKAIQQLCTKVFYIEKGRLEFAGGVTEGIQKYASNSTTVASGSIALAKRRIGNKKAFIAGVDAKLVDNNKKIQFDISVEASDPIEKTEIAIGLNDLSGNRIITLHSGYWNQQFRLSKGKNEFVCVVNNVSLKPGSYNMNVFLGDKYETLDYLDDPVVFELPQSIHYPAGIVPENEEGYLMADHTWILKTTANIGSR